MHDEFFIMLLKKLLTVDALKTSKTANLKEIQCIVVCTIHLILHNKENSKGYSHLCYVKYFVDAGEASEHVCVQLATYIYIYIYIYNIYIYIYASLV